MNLYTNIKNRRLQLNMTQTELAMKVGYRDKGSISRIENGSIDLTQSQIERFAKALECTPAYLMGWDDNDNSLSETSQFIDKLKDALKISVVLDLNSEEEQIIKNYRKLDERGKKHILDIISDELKYVRLSEYANNIMEGFKNEST